MPRDFGEVLRLMEATWSFKVAQPDVPLITMAMGCVGAISRLAGEAFGSAISFGSAGSSSAPGQIDAKGLRSVIDIVHNACSGTMDRKIGFYDVEAEGRREAA